ncbi:M48 family metalloprotease [Halobacteriovorax sp. GB3]|uniref:M48 family metalloprotease n=1 Tax=Halobacteriovorax sp. GB3 TaxID=2719615 RepID=UPI00235E39D7|nr:M48 family metalloprotease [Halobacteriovorax sp. GB3]MDD0853604.1 M48 family metalloprotease [Halobacteriovorax sp. GB3]
MKKAVLIFLFLFLSCQKEEQMTLENQFISGDHVFGALQQRDQFIQRPKTSACHRNDYYENSFFSIIFKEHINKTKHKLHIQLAQKILDHILKENSAYLDNSPYLESNKGLCVIIYDIDEINGFGVPGTMDDGIIYLTKKTIDQAKSIDEIASTLAHEMAHLTMNHHPERLPYQLFSNHSFYLFYERYFELAMEINTLTKEQQKLLFKVMNKSRNEVLIDKIESLILNDKRAFTLPLNRLFSNIDISLLKNEFSDFYEAYNLLAKENNSLTLKKRVLEHKMKKLAKKEKQSEMLVAWRELEADEVGLEFYLRSGFDPNEYSNRDKVLAKEQADAGIHCHGNEMPVLAGTHPASCYRVSNNDREMKIHHNEYQKFMKRQFPHLENLFKQIKDQSLKGK